MKSSKVARPARVIGTIFTLAAVFSTPVRAQDMTPAEIVLRTFSDFSNLGLLDPTGKYVGPIAPIGGDAWTQAKRDFTHAINASPEEPKTAPAKTTVSGICDRILFSLVSLSNLSGLECLKSEIRDPL